METYRAPTCYDFDPKISLIEDPLTLTITGSHFLQDPPVHYWCHFYLDSTDTLPLPNGKPFNNYTVATVVSSTQITCQKPMYNISQNHDLTVRIFFSNFWNQSHDLSTDYEFKFEHILAKTFSKTLRNQAMVKHIFELDRIGSILCLLTSYAGRQLKFNL